MKKGVQEILEKPCDYCGYSCKSWCQVCGIYYCSRTCQEKHWPYHKKICAKTLPQRLRKLMQLDWVKPTYRSLPNKVTLAGEKDREISWSWSCYSDLVKLCLGCGWKCGITLRSYFFSLQSFYTPNQYEGYYCSDCHSESRFIHPKTLMTLREVWPAIAICWKRDGMPRELLPMILGHFKVAWIQDIPIELIEEPPELHYSTASQYNKLFGDRFNVMVMNDFYMKMHEMQQQYHRENPAAAASAGAAVADMYRVESEEDFEEE